MDEFSAKIEALEHLWMRAWMQRDRNQMKAIAARDFIFLLGSEKPTILDRASWLEAATTRFRCTGYRFDEVYVRRHGPVAVFATRLGLEATIGDHHWNGDSWVVDLWQKSKIKRKWKLVERVLSRPDSDARMPEAIRAMQLWR
ncbi:nuclear transport factor 2 family protein [Erythrobacter sp. SN021]|uniref:nuclear transport factor 2 family protein n=1 Tax=Erythrobacter sp. SN021 TaxID=2912574 RepID=UPI001F24D32A|nr:nuclear transport factor 2 family protein [Erythrobacter sp. SN021]MCF8881413.1 nuclear transport factor 2 family protein [Erythrobacter sp. SN021]